jgi:spore coat polysaccharide biosynthesis predicted glycosyltransferase SpsG
MSYGWGHVIRSLSLAQRLEKEGVEVLLGIEGDEGVNRFLATVTQPHFKASFADVDAQPEVRAFSPELVVLDMLEAPDELLARLKRPGSRLVAFNDLALPYAHADVTVSPQILPAYAPARAGQAQLNGPDYFAVAESMLKHRDARAAGATVAKSVLVVLGGVLHRDHFATLVRAARGVRDLGLKFRVVLGFDHDVDLAKYPDLATIGVETLPGTNDLGALLKDAEFAIGASGYVKYEFAALGVPALLVSIVDHQEPLGKIFAERSKAADFVGDIRGMDPATLAKAIRRLSADFTRRAEMSQAGRLCVDGRALERIVKAIL